MVWLTGDVTPVDTDEARAGTILFNWRGDWCDWLTGWLIGWADVWLWVSWFVCDVLAFDGLFGRLINWAGSVRTAISSGSRIRIYIMISSTLTCIISWSSSRCKPLVCGVADNLISLRWSIVTGRRAGLSNAGNLCFSPCARSHPSEPTPPHRDDGLIGISRMRQVDELNTHIVDTRLLLWPSQWSSWSQPLNANRSVPNNQSL